MAKLIIGINDLETQCKQKHLDEVLKSWDSDKNYPLATSTVSFRSGKKVWWKCPVCGCQWESQIAVRTSGHGCPECGRRIAKEKRLKQRAEKNSLELCRSCIQIRSQSLIAVLIQQNVGVVAVVNLRIMRKKIAQRYRKDVS